MAKWPSRIIFGLWAVILVVMLVRAYLKPDSHSVYPIFANAAREWNQGVDMYDVAIARPHLDKFRYAPIVAVGFAPFAELPDSIGGVLWRLINGAVLFAGVVAFARTVFPGEARLTRTAVVLLAWLLIPLSLGSLNNAQSNSLIVGCLLLGTVATVDQRWNLAAVCFAVPVLFKVYPVSVVALVLLVQPRLSWRVAVLLAAGCLLPFAIQDSTFVGHIYKSWASQVANDNRHLNPLENSYRDFHMLLRFAGLTLAERTYMLLQLIAAGIAAVVVWRGHRLGWPTTRHLRAAVDLGCCWIILFGPATENCTYALLAPTMAFSAWEALQDGQPAWKRWWAAVTVALFITATVLISTPVGKTTALYFMPLGGLLVFAERLHEYGWSRRYQSVAVSYQLSAFSQ